MFRKSLISIFIIGILITIGRVTIIAQTAVTSGMVELETTDGKRTPVAGAVIDIYRTDIKGGVPSNKTNKHSVLLFIPRFCGENRILQRLCDVYGTSHKHGAVLARVGRKPSTGEIDFGTLWDDVRSGLGLPKDVMASTEMEFHASLAEQVKKRKARLLLILSGVEPGMEARVFSLMKELHALHKRYRLATPPRFQFVVADQFLIELYTNKMGIDWSELFTVKRETNRPFTRAELREYLAGVSPHKNSSTDNDHLADRLMGCTGGHLGLVTELCDTLQRTGWRSTAEDWDRTISPTLTDTKVGAGRAENAQAEVSVGGTVYRGPPLSGRWFDWCGNERFSQNGQGVRI